MPQIEIRPARKSDAKHFLGLVVALANFEKLPPPDAGARRRLIRDAFGTKPRYTLWIAELDGRVVAYAIFFFTYSSFLARPTLYLEDIFVHPDARGRGVATLVMKRLAREALKHGCGRFEWTVLDWNKPARSLYRGLGAKELKEWVVCRVAGPEVKQLAGGGGSQTKHRRRSR
ncbi:MAG: GNAT family N-acetyltransferase [Planctomycetes bacterium]|nr:GNAT family N-acetyltransferase [Planctomycetota bacterium]